MYPKAFDLDGNNSVDEMLIAASPPGERLTAEEAGDAIREADLGDELIEAFKAFDRDGNRSADEVLRAMSLSGERLTAEEG